MKNVLTPAISTMLLVCSMPSAAASLLAVGGVYGGSSQVKAYCYVFNGSGTSITFGARRILDQSGTDVTLPTQEGHCGHFNLPLGPNKTCLVSGDIGGGSVYACKIWINEAKALVRGNLDLRDSANKVLVSSPLR
ncbi:hypothetical protein EWI61_02060 [Methylolobus aquaticus]|nr:hypothetical protein EWI61_02060 [Methylolobus aquaticus]